MPAQTVVTLVDDDGDEFPIALPGIFPENVSGDKEAAMKIAEESIRNGVYRPNGTLRVGRVEYVGA